ncbi:hypothetical protein D7Y39_05010 [Stenotrophomonas maltophilia]|uniref:hypothetical protein n=1 Tax=Stenotrophomonas maltophilia TaxID=40324 RepID=UPI0015E037F9|nr:hypothetical protein [Stenotrophomonas maltophilia]MBA0289192.1 hypothetical protein [Stenotrophomonas maltophilia]NYB77536.1 hypothetical protein [Stenotrophomonas maltophilia]
MTTEKCVIQEDRPDLALDREIADFADGYLFYSETADGREGTYAPSVWERTLITDAIRTWVAMIESRIG